MDVLIVIGDQDSFHEEDDELIASPKWLADILVEEGVTGLFVIQARRAEILAARRRHDVIAAVRRHEIGLHGRDVHPNLPEIVERLGWDDGVEAVRAVEGGELELLGRVFDVSPVCSSQHRHLAAPQLYEVVRQLGLPYLFGYPAAPQTRSVCWYGGTLNVPCNAPVPDFLGFLPHVFDDSLHDDAAFARALDLLDRHVARCRQAELPLLAVFVCHPERLCYAGPLEQWFYGNGENRGPSAVPAEAEVRRSRTEVDRALTNFRTLIRRLRDWPGLEPITVAELVRRYGQQPSSITRADLTDVATRARERREIPIGTNASAGEALLGFAESVRHWSDTGQLPESVLRRDVLGPKAPPPIAPELPAVDRSAVISLANQIATTVASTGHLPDRVVVDGRAIGLGAAFGALAEAYLNAAQGTPPDESTHYSLGAWPRYPEIAVALGNCQRLCEEDPLVRPGLSTDAAALHARLQTWTLKPAWRR